MGSVTARKSEIDVFDRQCGGEVLDFVVAGRGCDASRCRGGQDSRCNAIAKQQHGMLRPKLIG